MVYWIQMEIAASNTEQNKMAIVIALPVRIYEWNRHQVSVIEYISRAIDLTTYSADDNRADKIIPCALFY